MIRLFFLFLLIQGIPSFIEALDKSPWIGNFLEFELKMNQAHENTHLLHTKRGIEKQKAFAEKTIVGLGFTPDPLWGVEFEEEIAKTNHLRYVPRSSAIAVRRSFLNDLIGDPVSLSALCSMRAIYARRSLRDPLLIYHSHLDTELGLSVGKEYNFSESTLTRIWGVFSVGSTPKAVPWIFFGAYLDHTYDDQFTTRVFLEGQNKTSGRSLHSKHHFKGYRFLKYHFVDAGIYCSFKNITGNFFVALRRRIKSKYTTKDTMRIEVGMDIPFSF